MRPRRAPRDIQCVFGNLPNRQTCGCAPCAAWRLAYTAVVRTREAARRGQEMRAAARRRDARTLWNAHVQGTA